MSELGTASSSLACCRQLSSDADYRQHKPDYLEEALIFRGYGWSVFPTIGKRPAVSWKWLQSGRARDHEIGRMFRRRSGISGVAVVLARISGGLATRDFDTIESYKKWASRNQQLATLCPTVLTARGAHVYCRLWDETWATWEDGELRGSVKQYALLPPSEHPYGGRYCWLRSIPRISDFPRLLLHETGFIDDEHPPRRMPSQMAKPWTRPARPTEDTQTEVCVTQEVLSMYLPVDVSEVVVSEVAVSEVVVSEVVVRVVMRCLPCGPGQRHACIFRLARCLKGVASLSTANSSELEAVVRHWHRLARPVIRTKDWNTSWVDFVDAWERLRYPIRDCPALELAPPWLLDDAPEQVLGYADEPTRRLFKLCRALDAQTGGEPFYLSCRTAQDICAFTNTMTASHRLKTFVDQGILDLIRPGTRSATKRKAATYKLRRDNDALPPPLFC